MDSLFLWFVPDTGFHWVDAPADDVFSQSRSDEARWLSSLSPVGARATGRVTEPLRESPALFRDFSNLDLTEAGIKAFADQHGSLGVTTEIRWQWSEGDPVRITAPHADDTTWVLGEPFSLWEAEVAALSRAVEMWDAAQNENIAVLRDHIHWMDGPNGERVAQYASHRPGHVMKVEWGDDRGYEMRAIVDTRTAHLGKRSFVSSGDLVRPARLYAQDAINERIRKYCPPTLTYAADTDRQDVLLVPDHLLGAIWLQFANSMGGDHTYERCSACGEWFEIGPGSARRSRRYCSNACKMRAQRERQRQAREMHNTGRSVEQIAGSLGSNPESVRKWVGKS